MRPRVSTVSRALSLGGHSCGELQKWDKHLYGRLRHEKRFWATTNSRPNWKGAWPFTQTFAYQPIGNGATKNGCDLSQN